MKLCGLVCLGALWAGATASAAAGGDDAPRRVRAFYFGNSLTGCTNPQWHADLGRSAGKEWTCQAFLGAGWQLWQHREQLRTDKAVFSTGPKGELTLAPEFVASAPYKAKSFFRGRWDAIVMQSFAGHLKHVTAQMWGRKFDKAVDTGDIAAATDIARLFLKMNPDGCVYLYVNWPAMPRGRIPPADQLPEWARGRKKLRTAEFPLRDEFDYEKQWLKKYAPTDKPWIGSVNRTRDFNYKLFEGLKGNLPDVCKAGRLRMIPTGDIFLELDRKMRAGKVPGIATIKDFYTDVQHIRAGLPRYAAAAAFYACLFRENPGKLDWKLYNNREKYGPDPYHDKGELLEITPQRAKIVNDTIWEVVKAHPYTGPGK
jgi:hypothetical protein